MADAARERLLRFLVERSLRRSDTPSFRLASGKMSNFYVDCRATTMFAPAMPLVAQAVLDLLPADTEAIGGLTMGADPIAFAVACYSATAGRPINAFSVRKKPKTHGLGKWIEGCLRPGTKVAVIDDVCTTGASTIQAIQHCRNEGLEVVAVVLLVDREEENGMEAIRQVAGPGVPVLAVFTRHDLERGSSRR